MTVISSLLVKLGIDNSGIGSGMAGATKLIVAGAVTAGAAATKALYDVGSTFDDVSDTIRVGTGESGKALEALTGSAEKVATTIPASFEDAADSVTDLHQRLGLTGPILEKVSKQVLEAGRLTEEPIDVSGLTGALNAFEVTGKAIPKTLDDIFTASQQTNVPMNELIGVVSSAAPQLKQFGFGLSDSALLLGNLDKAGINPSKTVGTLSKAMVTFAKDGREPKQALQETIDQIEKFTKAGDDASAINMAGEIFGTRGAGQFVAAVKSGKLNVDSLMKTTSKSGDSILKASKDTADFSEKWQMFKNQALLKIKPLATTVFDLLGKGMAKLEKSDALDQIADGAKRAEPTLIKIGHAIADTAKFLNEHRTLVVGVIAAYAGFRAIMATMAAYRAVQAAVTAVQAGYAAATYGSVGATYAQGAATKANLVGFVASKAVMIATTVATKAMAAGQWLLNAALSANPITLIVIALVALAAGLIYAYKHSETFRNIVQAAFGVVQSVASSVASFFTDKIPAAFHTVVDAVGSALGWVKSNWPTILAVITGPIGLAVLFVVRNWDKIKAATQAAWNKVKAITSSVWGAISGFIRSQIDQVVSGIEAVSRVPGIVKDAFESARSAVADKLKAVVTLVKGLPDRVVNGLGDIGSKLLDVGEKLIEGFIQGIRNKFDDVKGALGDLTGKLTSWKGPPAKDRVLLKPAGQDLIDGLVEGIESRFSKVENVLSGLTDKIAKAVDSKKLTKAEGKQAQALVDHFDKDLAKLSNRYDRWQEKIADQQKKLDDMEAMRKQTADSFTGELDLGSLFTETPPNQYGFGGGSSISFQAIAGAVSAIATRVRAFAGKLRALLKAGIPKGLVQEVAALGSVKGSAVADALLSGTAQQVHDLAVDYTSFTDAATEAGTVLTESFFNVGFAAQQGLIDGLLSDGAGIEAAIDKLGDKATKKLKKKWHIASPSKVWADEIGVPAGQGVGVGFDRAISAHDFDARVQDLASVPSAGSATLARSMTAASASSETSGMTEAELLAWLERVLSNVAVDASVSLDDRQAARVYVKGRNATGVLA